MFRYYAFADDTRLTFEYAPGDNETLNLLTDENIQQKYKPDLTDDGLYRIPLVQVFDSDLSDDTLEAMKQRALDALLSQMPDPVG